jgi:hypothetical protein
MTTDTPTAETAPAPVDTVAVAPTDAAPATLLTADPAAAPQATDTPAATDAAPAGDGQDGKPAEGKPADDKPAEDKPQGAPDEYADFTAPEGVTLNAEAIDALKAFAKEKNLTQEDAQKLVDMGAQVTQANVARLNEQIAQVQAQWLDAAKTDKEFGGDALNENLAIAARARETFGTPELKAALDTTGMGNHPEVVRFFVRVGKAISEDRLVAGTTRPAQVSREQRMYPTMNS